MQTIYTVIRDCGDGSQTVEWRKLMNVTILEKLENIDSYQSGDGVQIREYLFPDDFDLDAWATINYIIWADDYESDDEDDLVEFADEE